MELAVVFTMVGIICAAVLILRFLCICLIASWAPDESRTIAVSRQALRRQRLSSWGSEESAAQLRDRWMALGYMFLSIAAAAMDVMVNFRRLPVVFAIGASEGLFLAIVLPILAAGAGLMMHAATHAHRNPVPTHSFWRPGMTPLALCMALFVGCLICGSALQNDLVIFFGVMFVFVCGAIYRFQSRFHTDRSIDKERIALLNPIPLALAVVLLGGNMTLQGFANYTAVKILLEDREPPSPNGDAPLAGNGIDTDMSGQSASDPLSDLPYAFAMLAAVLAVSESAFAFYAKEHFLAWRCMALASEAKIWEASKQDHNTLNVSLANRHVKVGSNLQQHCQLFERQRAYRRNQLELERRLAGLTREINQASITLERLMLRPKLSFDTEAKNAILSLIREASREVVQCGREDARRRNLDSVKQLVTGMIGVFSQAQDELARSFAESPIEQRESADLLKLLNMLRAERASAVAAFHAADATRLNEADQSLEHQLRMCTFDVVEHKKENPQ